ncbi:hypothetical protein QYM36_016223 [Artemia franciscana]|uniref:TRAF-type domain-containing protein n=1 Tax=Artemia franciscana TaxID=6661 RepID=A0AA88KTI4_ARTSF|nr:hypothetical protein QYM36_016223 [Artemia franciscana]
MEELTLTCNNQIRGCPATVALEELETHLLKCSFNPKRLVSCSCGCGITICFGELANHNYARSLRLEMKETLERIEKANENKMSKMHNINSNLVKRLERVKEETEDKISKMHNINAFLVKELERVKKANDEMSKILGINANLVEILERVVKRNEDKMSKMYNINANLVKELERVKKTNHEMSKIFGINANLVKKLERVEKGNEDKMLMIKSKLELLEAEMAKFRISKSNSLHIESATLKQVNTHLEI